MGCGSSISGGAAVAAPSNNHSSDQGQKQNAKGVDDTATPNAKQSDTASTPPGQQGTSPPQIVKPGSPRLGPGDPQNPPTPDKPFADSSSEDFVPQFDEHDRSSNATPNNGLLNVDSGSPKANNSRYRSKSVVVLEKISKKRAEETEGENAPFLDVVQSTSMSVDSFTQSVKADDDKLEKSTRNTVVRTRRLSSIYNEFASNVENFLMQHEKSNPDGGDADDDDRAASNKSPEKSESSYLRRIFSLLADQSTGTVSKERLIEGFRRMGRMETASTTIETMFNCADENHDGILQFEEFAKFFRHLKSIDFVSADDADIDTVPPPKPRARNYSTILVAMKSYRTNPLPSQAGRIKCIALSQQRNLYAVSHRNDKSVHIYDFNGVEVRVLSGHKDSLLGIAFSPDRKVVATVSRDCMLILWDCTVGHAVNTVQHPGIVTAVAFSADGKSIYTGCQDNLVRRFSGTKCHLKAVLDRLPRAELGVTVALACQHHANKEIVFSRSCDRGAIVAEATTLKVVTVLEGHKSMVWQAHYRSDGTKLLTSCERFVKVWATSNYSTLFVLDSERFIAEKGIIKNTKPKLWTTASFCPPHFGPMIVAFNTDTNVMFVDCESGKLILTHNFRSSVYAAALGIDNSVMVCGDDWGNVYKVELLA